MGGLCGLCFKARAAGTLVTMGVTGLDPLALCSHEMATESLQDNEATLCWVEGGLDPLALCSHEMPTEPSLCAVAAVELDPGDLGLIAVTHLLPCQLPGWPFYGSPRSSAVSSDRSNAQVRRALMSSFSK